MLHLDGPGFDVGGALGRVAVRGARYGSVASAIATWLARMPDDALVGCLERAGRLALQAEHADELAVREHRRNELALNGVQVRQWDHVLQLTARLARADLRAACEYDSSRPMCVTRTD